MKTESIIGGGIWLENCFEACFENVVTSMFPEQAKRDAAADAIEQEWTRVHGIWDRELRSLTEPNHAFQLKVAVDEKRGVINRSV